MITREIAGQLEEWRPVKGFEGLYEVSNMGNVRSLARITHLQTNNHLKIKNYE